MNETKPDNDDSQDSAAENAEMIEPVRQKVEAAGDVDATTKSVTLTVPGDDGPPTFVEASPHSFTGYEILREIQRGGQGVVYEAIQKSTKRKVAIKVMKEGPFAGPGDKVRFQREVQILAQLNHPNIVAIHDSGEAVGHFFFVMNYISGHPLDVHMANQQRSIDETLKLFCKICEAVNAAHMLGIIHRDLKPGNIRVDDSGEPHILDFGLAKLSDDAATDVSRPQVMTMSGQFIGSLPWASPEQAEGSPGKIDIRTDVYSLGVVLYQMLTGKFPYEVAVNMREVLDNIIKAAPAKPSTIRRKINDEVETIVLKSLSKERERRYQSAGELARDLGRYLAGEPIEAKRDARFYVLRKHLARHKWPVLVATMFVLLLIGFSVTFSIQAARERSANQEARKHLSLALAERGVRLLETDNSLGLLYLLEARTVVDDNPRIRDARASLWTGWYQDLTDNFVHLIGDPNPVFAIRFSSDSSLLTTASTDTVTTWEIATGKRRGKPVKIDSDGFGSFLDDGRILRTYKGQKYQYWDLATGKVRKEIDATDRRGSEGRLVSPDGKLVFEWYFGGPARVKDALTGKICGRPWKMTGYVHAVDFGPDGKSLVTRGKEARLWNVTTGKEIGELAVGDPLTTKVSFSPDGTLLATRILDRGSGTVLLWDTATGKRHGEALHIGGDIPDNSYAKPALFSPDGSLLATQINDTVFLWDVKTTDRHDPPILHGARINQLIFSPDGDLLATAGFDNMVRLWEIPGGQLHGQPLHHQERIKRMVFSPDGKLLATIGQAGTVRLWATSKREPGEQPLPHSELVLAVAFSSDGKLLVTGSLDQTARITDLENMLPYGEPFEHEYFVTSVALSPDGKLLATCGGEKQEVRFWDAKSGEPVGDPIPQKSHSILTFSPDGKVLATLSSSDGSVRLWEIASGRLVREPLLLEKPWGPAWISIRFSPKGDRIFTRHGVGSWNIRDLSTGSSVPVDGSIIAVSPSGERIGIWTGPQELRVRGPVIDQGDSCTILLETKTSMLSAAFSADDKLVAVCTGNSARLWSATDGRPLGARIEFPSTSPRIALNPDATLLAASFGRSVRLWDTTTGQPFGHPRRLEDTALDVSFSPDGRWLLIGGVGTAHRLFRIPKAVTDLREMQLRTWVELGRKLDSEGLVETIPPSEIPTLQEELIALDSH